MGAAAAAECESTSTAIFVVDLDGDGARDALLLGTGGALRIAMSQAPAHMAAMVRCKFGGGFEARRCWSCAGGVSSDDIPVPPHVAAAVDGAGPVPPHQVVARWSWASPERIACTPPALDSFPGAPRAYAGEYRVELTFNDQQWTKGRREYEYTVPWRAVGAYPSSGPAAGGTLVQVAGGRLSPIATGAANPQKWTAAFTAFDTDGDVRLSLLELTGLVASLVDAEALPEGSPSAAALLAAHDADADGALSYEEYQAARPRYGGGGPTDAPSCAFGGAATAGLAGWRPDGEAVTEKRSLAGEWIACVAPAASAAAADVSMHLDFESDVTGVRSELSAAWLRARACARLRSRSCRRRRARRGHPSRT